MITEDRLQAESLRACLLPIVGEHPAGVDARLDPEHELLRAELGKLTSLADQTPDWAAVERLGCALLQTRSKDLTVAAYVAAAHALRTSSTGMQDSCVFLSIFVERFQADLFPVRARARSNAVGWWVEWGATRVAALPSPTRDQLSAMREATVALRDTVSGWLGKDAPAFSTLLNALDKVDAVEPTPSLPVREGERASASAAERKQASRGETEAAEPPLPSDEAGLQRYLRAHATRMIALAQARMKDDDRDARAYRWLREAVWLGWEHPPAEDRRGRTSLPPPNPVLRSELDGLYTGARWQELVQRCEAQLVRTPHWFDLSFWSARALGELGAPFAAARSAVERATHALHQRVPELALRSYSDGTPCAGARTREWLSTFVAPRRESARSEEPPRASATASAPQAPSARDWFIQRCRSAAELRAQGDNTQARLIYTGLLRDVDAFSLEQWDPALAVPVLQALCELSGAQTPSGVKDTEAQALYVRLARLAPSLIQKRSASARS